MKKLLLSGIALLLLSLPAAAASTMTVLEFGSNTIVTNSDAQIAPMPPLVEQTPVDFTAGAAQSAAFNAQTRYVRLQCNVRCSVKFETGSSSVATSNVALAVDSPEYFGVPKGQAYKVSVIASP